MNVKKIREDFALFNSKKPVVYMDSACMSLKPKQVIEKMNDYYNNYPACAGRSNHRLSVKATEECNSARKTLKKFLNAKSEKEIIFTRNTTEGMNIVAKSLKFDTVITTDKEHNSNLVPWLELKKYHNITHEILNTTHQDDADKNSNHHSHTFNIQKFEELLSNAKKQNKKILVSMAHFRNIDGTSIPIKEIIKIAHDYSATVLLDGAQSIPHIKTDVQKLGADLIAFSGHKMLGPTGTGVLYGKQEILEQLKPYNVGGDTVKNTFYDKFEFEELPDKFEAGLQDYAGIIGLGEATRYLEKHITDVEDHEQKLNKIITEGLHNSINILGPKDYKHRSGIISFTAKNNMLYHEISLLLDNYANIMIRSGRHCVHSWFNANNIDGSARASLYLYNTEEEAKYFVEKTLEVLKMKK